jgi:hypothetical protein
MPMKLLTHSLPHGIVSIAFLLLFVGCSSMSDDFARGKAGWRERPTGAPKLLSPVSKNDVENNYIRISPKWRGRSVGSPKLFSPASGKNDETFSRRTTLWRERPIGTPKLLTPRIAQPENFASVGVDEDKRKSEDLSTESSSAPASLSDAMIISELQSTWSKLSPEELAEQLEKGLHKEKVKAILNSASVVEVVNPWGKVWVMGSDTPPVFFDVRGRLIDWGWFEYHNLVADLDPGGDSLAPPIRIVKQPSLNDIMPLPKGDTAF